MIYLHSESETEHLENALAQFPIGSILSLIFDISFLTGLDP
jgi:hypothetical protein